MMPAKALTAAWQRVFGTTPELSETHDLAARLRDALPVPDHVSVYSGTPSIAAQKAGLNAAAESAVLGELAALTVSHGSPWAAAEAMFGGGRG